MLPSGRDPIPVTEDESCQEEFVFLARMAAVGAFVRVDSAMYFKRLHNRNAFVRWRNFPDWRRRRGWISMGAGMYRVAGALASQELRPRILGQVLDRLAVERHGRGHFYAPAQTPPEIHRFVRDFVAYAAVPDADLHIVSPNPLEPPIHPEVLESLETETRSSLQRARYSTQLGESGTIVIDLRESSAESTLGFGWSHPEPWGVWSDGPEAALRIPVSKGCAWRATVEGRVYPPSERVIVGCAPEGEDVRYYEVKAARNLQIVVESRRPFRKVIRFDLPEARAPADDHISADRRMLGIGLTSLRVDLL
jgi:hypothetical protein